MTMHLKISGRLNTLLQNWSAADKFKDYDVLKKRLDYVLGIRGVPKMQDQETVEEEQDALNANVVVKVLTV